MSKDAALQALLKERNIRNILSAVRKAGPLSQAAIAGDLNLQPSTVSNLMKDLKENGWVHSVGKGASTQYGGKRSDLLNLNPSCGLVMGFNIKRDGIISYTYDFSGILQRSDTTSLEPGKSDEVVELISSQLKKTSSSSGNSVLGCAVAVSSIVDTDGDVLVSADFPWQVMDFKNKLANSIGPDIALVVENDANCAAFHAYHHWGGVHKNMFVLFSNEESHSVGSGLILDGRLYRGKNGGAGEIRKDTSGPYIESIWPSILSSVELLDPEVVVLTGTDSGTKPKKDQAFIIEIQNRLSVSYPRLTSKTLFADDVPVLGAVRLVNEIIDKNIAKDSL